MHFVDALAVEAIVPIHSDGEAADCPSLHLEHGTLAHRLHEALPIHLGEGDAHRSLMSRIDLDGAPAHSPPRHKLRSHEAAARPR